MRISVLFICVLAIIGCCANVSANEANNRFGDRSWQFDTPSDKIAKQNSLVLYCQQNPKNCDNGTTTTNTTNRTLTPPGGGGNGGNGGLNLGGDSIIGNNITVVIEGDGNVVEITGDQSLVESPQTIDHNVSDNNVVIDQSTTNQSSDDKESDDDSSDDEDEGSQSNQ